MRRQKRKNIRLRRVWDRLSRIRMMNTKYEIKSRPSRYFLSACERHAQTKEQKYPLAACLESFESNPYNDY